MVFINRSSNQIPNLIAKKEPVVMQSSKRRIIEDPQLTAMPSIKIKDII